MHLRSRGAVAVAAVLLECCTGATGGVAILPESVPPPPPDVCPAFTMSEILLVTRRDA